MKVSEKLQLIQKISDLTQEKLAKKLGVSFATLNSWLNERSIPRKKAQERIDELYREYTGQKVIPEEALDAKKKIIIKLSQKFKDILGIIMNNPDIYDQFLLSLTYNTNRIEGSTITESETAALLFEDKSLPNRSLIEQPEVKNHETALRHLFDYIMHSSSIDENFILKLHMKLMNGIRDDAGIYRKHPVRIVGANIPTANYVKLPHLMKKLIDKIADKEKDTISHIALIHSEFEKIHPFSDGNGRIGRLIMTAMALRKNFAPVVIKQEYRQRYFSYLQKAQQTNDTTLLEDFVCDAIQEGFDILERKQK